MVPPCQIIAKLIDRCQEQFLIINPIAGIGIEPIKRGL